jgi:Ca-activated chloride channel family protein
MTGGRTGRSLSLPFVKTAGRRNKRVRGTALVVLVSGLSSFIWSQVRASEGEELFKTGDYAGAASYYQQSLEKDASNPALYFNLGGSLYRQQKYEEAADAFTQALNTDDILLQAQSYYNRGNSQFFSGAAVEKKDKEQALKQWNEAKKSFEAALKLEPEDKAAVHNLQMVSKKLEQLKEEMRQSGQQCDNPQEGENGDQQKDQDKESQDKQGEQNQNQQQKKDQQSQQNSDQEQKQEGQGEESDNNPEEQEEQGGAAEEQESDPKGQEEQPVAEQQPEKEQSEKQKAVPEPEQQEETPTVEDIQQAAAQKEEQKEEQEKQEQMSAEDRERRMMGKMTEQEARNLLNSLKEEQGELNFIPQGAHNNESVDKDW